MKITGIWNWAAPLIVGTALAATQLVATPVWSAPAESKSPCNRTCLRGVLDRYLDAVIRHDPAAAPLAADAHATLNAAPLANGAGIWHTATGFGSVQRRYFDPVYGQAAFFGLIDEGADPAIVSLRLKIRHRRVQEAEWTVARKEAGGLFSIEGLTEQPPPPETPLPPADRTSRAQLVAAADAYFSGIEHHDGAGVPHIEGCERIENGVKVTHRLRSAPLGPMPGSAPSPAPAATALAATAPGLAQETPAAASGAPGAAQESRSGDCAAGLEMFANTITEASHRRYPLVDEQAGVVMGMTLFHRPAGSTIKRNLLTEFFYEKQGRIAAIYAAMYYLDAGAPDTPGWE